MHSSGSPGFCFNEIILRVMPFYILLAFVDPYMSRLDKLDVNHEVICGWCGHSRVFLSWPPTEFQHFFVLFKFLFF